HGPSGHGRRLVSPRCRNRGSPFVVISTSTQGGEMQYALLIYGAEGRWETFSEADQQAMTEDYMSIGRDPKTKAGADLGDLSKATSSSQRRPFRMQSQPHWSAGPATAHRRTRAPGWSRPRATAPSTASAESERSRARPSCSSG